MGDGEGEICGRWESTSRKFLDGMARFPSGLGPYVELIR